MKKNPLLAQLAAVPSKPAKSSTTLPDSQPDNMVTYQPTILPDKEKKGGNKGIWLRHDEIEILAQFRRKLYLDGIEATPNLIIRALIHDLPHNPRAIETISRLKRE